MGSSKTVGVYPQATENEKENGSTLLRSFSPNDIRDIISGFDLYREVWIDSGAMIGRETNGASATTVETTGFFINYDSFAFGPDIEQGVNFRYSIPDSWDTNTLKVKIYWTALSGASITATDVAWGVRAKANDDLEELDSEYGSQITILDEVSATDLSSTLVHITTASSSITVGNTPTINSIVNFEISREVDDVNDNFNGIIYLIGVKLQYLESNLTSIGW